MGYGMKTFLSNILSSFIGVFLASIALGFLLITLITGFFITLAEEIDSGTRVRNLEEDSVLIVRLAYPIHEKTSEDPFDHYDFNTMESRVVLGLDDIIENIRRATNDPFIKGIYLNVSPDRQGWATMESIRTALSDFKASGKWIVAYNEIYSHQSYYLSSVANEIYLNPQGYMEFQGLSGQSIFLKDTLAKLDIEMQVLRGPDNEYKSAVETFVNSEMSDNSRYQMQVLLNGMWKHMLENVSADRKTSPEKLNQLANQLGLVKPEDSVNSKLIDALKYHDEVRDLIKEKMQLGQHQEIPAVNIEDYAMIEKNMKRFQKIAKTKPADQIAIIYADGEIASGENDRGIVGSITTAYAIRSAREDKNVKAIVLRVNSPGGSALASDVLLRELYLCAQSKPTIASFGDVAASGGYYMSVAAHRIFAEPNTITGSIGVFSLFPNMKGFFNNKLGVTFDNVNTNQYSDFGNISQPLKDYEKRYLQKQVENTYTTFKNHVAEGRSLTPERVEEIAKGRVWSGEDAIKVGLVDEIGGLEAAIAEAAMLAKIEHYELLKLPVEDTPFSRFMQDADEHAQSWIIQTFLGEEFIPAWKQKKRIERITHMQDVQAMMPFELSIK